MRLQSFRAPLASLIFAAALLAVNASPAPVPADAQTALPPLPAGWPSTTLQMGMGDGPGGASVMRSTAPFGFRYQYLSGGAPGGWATWNSPSGAFATFYIQDSIANGMTPVFTYYQMRQSPPNAGLGDGDADYNNLQNQATMAAYYADLKVFFQRAAAFPSTKVVLHVEPDLWGFLEQRATSDDATTIPAQVASSGTPELAGLPNTVSGFARAITRLRDQYAPNVILGYHLSVWGTGNDILYSKPDNATVTALATRAANFYLSLQAPFDIAFGEYSDRDAAFKQYQYGDGGASWWAAGDFSRSELFLGRFVSLTQKRMVMWQIPVGNTRMLAENNTWEHYQDNKVEWLLDDATRANMNAYAQAGVVAFLFGRGADGPTCFCDAAKDGVTNPPAINGNTRTSLSADDDGGFFRDRARAYYASGAMALPSGSTSPTSTPTPTVATRTSTPTPTVAASTSTPTRTPTSAPGATSTPTRTSVATATPTRTSTPSTGTTTVTFDDLTGPNRALNGQYPTGVINWGSATWWLAAPWGRFTTNSISFTSAAQQNAAFTFVTPQRLLQVDAYNGGTVASTVSLSCAGQTTRTMSVAVGQLLTIATGWTTTCTTVTVGSSNGWNTNFDNLVISSTTASSTATPTSTPQATATRTPTPTNTPLATSVPTLTPTPGAGQTVTFDDLANPGRALNGAYPTGVANWGSTSTWYLSGPWKLFTTQSVSFNGAGITSGSVTLAASRRLVRVDAYNGGTVASTVTLSCSGQPTVTTSVGVNQIASIATNWTTPCSVVTMTSSNGWNTNFDNLVVQ
jgi:hypothetical protein